MMNFLVLYLTEICKQDFELLCKQANRQTRQRKFTLECQLRLSHLTNCSGPEEVQDFRLSVPVLLFLAALCIDFCNIEPSHPFYAPPAIPG